MSGWIWRGIEGGGQVGGKPLPSSETNMIEKGDANDEMMTVLCSPLTLCMIWAINTHTPNN